jgi:hypothetical protein
MLPRKYGGLAKPGRAKAHSPHLTALCGQKALHTLPGVFGHFKGALGFQGRQRLRGFGLSAGFGPERS